MLPLFENVCETSKNPNICTLAQEFNLDSTDYMASYFYFKLRTGKLKTVSAVHVLTF